MSAAVLLGRARAAGVTLRLLATGRVAAAPPPGGVVPVDLLVDLRSAKDELAALLASPPAKPEARARTKAAGPAPPAGSDVGAWRERLLVKHSPGSGCRVAREWAEACGVPVVRDRPCPELGGVAPAELLALIAYLWDPALDPPKDDGHADETEARTGYSGGVVALVGPVVEPLAALPSPVPATVLTRDRYGKALEARGRLCRAERVAVPNGEVFVRVLFGDGLPITRGEAVPLLACRGYQGLDLAGGDKGQSSWEAWRAAMVPRGLLVEWLHERAFPALPAVDGPGRDVAAGGTRIMLPGTSFVVTEAWQGEPPGLDLPPGCQVDEDPAAGRRQVRVRPVGWSAKSGRFEPRGPAWMGAL